MRAGLIPSRALQERRIVHERNELNGDTANLTSDKAEGTILPTDKRTDVWSRPSCIYAQILALKKTGFSPVKNTSQNYFDFCLPLFYATFQCGP